MLTEYIQTDSQYRIISLYNGYNSISVTLVQTTCMVSVYFIQHKQHETTQYIPVERRIDHYTDEGNYYVQTE